MKRQLFLVHRWTGVVLCLFMAMWFISGVVMMYVGYPKLTHNEHLAALPPLDGRACCHLAPQAQGARSVRLTTIGGNPRLVIVDKAGVPAAHDAVSGQVLPPIGQTEATLAAAAFAGRAPVRYLGPVDEDAWTHSRALDVHRPLHAVQVEDDARTVLYLSGRTGEVVRDATLSERRWNWVGAWIHWLYAFRGGALDAHWPNIVIWTSVAGTVLAVTGLVVGLLRWRFFSRYRHGGRSPYRGLAFRWHHLVGLGFGALTITWIFSGLMSLNPWGVFDSGARALDQAAFGAGPPRLDPGDLEVPRLLHRLEAGGFTARELEWRQVSGKLTLLAWDGAGRSRLLDPEGTSPPRAMLPIAELALNGARLMTGAIVVRHQVLTEYDSYYYGRAPHTMTGHVERRLPVLRLAFDDPHATWVHLDPYTGEVVGRLDRHQRVKRWLFAFLHSFDWWPLMASRPAWDLLLIAGSLGGLVLSVTGIWMGARRLRLKAGAVRS
ncbi:MAG TPA: PepSY domain-containing protein [Burkholderiaceae bacterium]|nr:PepSY domain-containing protein [Burkholderiaceae bacterium]